MTGWPPWRRAQPAQLPRYVHAGVLAKVLRPELGLPGRSGAPPEVRVRQLFEAFAGAGVRYADEQPTPQRGRPTSRAHPNEPSHGGRGRPSGVASGVRVALGCFVGADRVPVALRFGVCILTDEGWLP